MSTRARQRQRILVLLASEWNKRPDLRFGQLVENFIFPGASFSEEREHWEHCIYSVSDKKAIERLMEGLDS